MMTQVNDWRRRGECGVIRIYKKKTGVRGLTDRCSVEGISNVLDTEEDGQGGVKLTRPRPVRIDVHTG